MYAARAHTQVMKNARPPTTSGMLSEPGGATRANSAGSMAVSMVPMFCAMAMAETR
ncbi:hypothetical protein D3C71_2062300 [compost metagenome]